MPSIIILVQVFLGLTSAQFGFFDQMFGGGGNARPQDRVLDNYEPKVNNPVENTYKKHECKQYLCEDTLECVASPKDCPCPFPDSQLRCVHSKGYVCISKPSNEDGPTCDFVLKNLA